MSSKDSNLDDFVKFAYTTLNLNQEDVHAHKPGKEKDSYEFRLSSPKIDSISKSQIEDIVNKYLNSKSLTLKNSKDGEILLVNKVGIAYVMNIDLNLAESNGNFQCSIQRYTPQLDDLAEFFAKGLGLDNENIHIISPKDENGNYSFQIFSAVPINREKINPLINTYKDNKFLRVVSTLNGITTLEDPSKREYTFVINYEQAETKGPFECKVIMSKPTEQK